MDESRAVCEDEEIMPEYNLHIHFIEKKTGKIIAKLYCYQVPAVGEECRFSGDRFYKVVQVVHVYDEDGSCHRANIGLEKI